VTKKIQRVGWWWKIASKKRCRRGVMEKGGKGQEIRPKTADWGGSGAIGGGITTKHKNQKKKKKKTNDMLEAKPRSSPQHIKGW